MKVLILLFRCQSSLLELRCKSSVQTYPYITRHAGRAACREEYAVTANRARQSRLTEPRVLTMLAVTISVYLELLSICETLNINLLFCTSIIHPGTDLLYNCQWVYNTHMLPLLKQLQLPVRKDIRKDDYFPVLFQTTGSCHNI